MRVVLSARAADDLREHYAFLEQQRAMVGERFMDSFERTCERLARHPRIGRT